MVEIARKEKGVNSDCWVLKLMGEYWIGIEFTQCFEDRFSTSGGKGLGGDFVAGSESLGGFRGGVLGRGSGACGSGGEWRFWAGVRERCWEVKVGF